MGEGEGRSWKLEFGITNCESRTMKQATHQLHYRQDFKLLVIDAFQYKTDYYNVDYVFLFTNPPPIFSAYLSKKGLRQASTLGLKNLLHNPSWQRIFIQGKNRFSYVDRLRKDTTTPSGVSQSLKRIETIFGLFHDIGRTYFYTDGPTQAGVEKHSKRPAVYRMLGYIGRYKIEAHRRLSMLEALLTREVNRLGRQLGVSAEALLMHTVDEFRNGSRSHFRHIPQSIRNRIRGYVYSQRNGRWTVLTGATFRAWKRQLLPLRIANSVRGIPAYQVPNLVRGRVRRHFSFTSTTQLRPGEILVTGMTNPQMFPILKRARGIVTDEGGLMCHAAIVSRELKKPCIVGTREATQLFQDGDVIEMDTSTGIVKRVSTHAN